MSANDVRNDILRATRLRRDGIYNFQCQFGKSLFRMES